MSTAGESMASGGEPPGSDAALAKIDEPSPPRPPLTGTEALKLIGGLVVVCTGLGVLAVIAAIAMFLVKGMSSEIVAIATSAFGVIGTDGGHGNLPVGGHRISPLAVVGSPRPWPSVLPAIVS
ncbi:MAG: hypothetical protein LC790_13255 [Actinobacteria bacterium]|nr:hypothetical protein [Actinomycetota bacterium]